MTQKHCCLDMERQIDNWECGEHRTVYECPDAIISNLPNSGYGIIIHDGGHSLIHINYCPWCGKKLLKHT